MMFRLAMCVTMLALVSTFHLRAFERAVDQSTLSQAEAIDIIKILNLDTLRAIENSTDVEEAEVLKHKSII
jgi:hypothetical protein